MASTWVGALLHKSRQQGKSPFPYQAAFMINNPVRRALLKPARIVDKLGLAGSEHVLVLGAGSGFFSVEIARFHSRTTRLT
jgi:protein-L-isoaspartate O-methyltransferase